MKFNFRKVAGILSSAVMISSTVALAAATTYPAPYVQSGGANVAIVYGTNIASTDYVAAIDITANLQAKLAAQTASGSSGASSTTTVTGGDFVQLAKSTNAFNLGESMNAFYATMDESELSAVLAEGVYTNDNNDEFDYQQKIALGGLVLQHFQDSNFNDDKPIIGFDIDDGKFILNYTLDFTPDRAAGGASYAYLETSEITMLGRSYYVVDATDTANGLKLTLLDTANSVIVTEGETATVTTNEGSYDISLVFIDSTDVILNVNGQETNKLAQGGVFKVAEDTYVAVKSNLYNSKDTGISKVEVSIGSGKIELEEKQEVKVNNEKVSKDTDYELFTYFTVASANETDQIVLEWVSDKDTYMSDNSELVLPGFGTIKISMAGFTKPAQEITTVKAGSDTYSQLQTTVSDGDVTLPLLYTNATGDMIALGKDVNTRLVTSIARSGSGRTLVYNMSIDDYFVATWISGDDAESYVLKISDIDDTVGNKNTTTIESVAEGSGEALTLDIGETDEIGEVSFTLVAVPHGERDKWVNITTAPAGGSGTVYMDKLVTAEGMVIQLPFFGVNDTCGANMSGCFNVSDAFRGGTRNSTYPMLFTSSAGMGWNTWRMNLTEEDKDANIFEGDSIQLTIGPNTGDEIHVTDGDRTELETEDDSKLWEAYANSTHATKYVLDKNADQYDATVTYHGSEAFAEVYVSETGAVIESTGTTISSGTVTEIGSISVKDSEVSSVSGKNLIVVGGSCVNSVAASLVGGSYCGADWETATSVGSGSFLIETFDRTGGKVATLVAGYNAGDTTNAAKYLTSQAVDTTAGKKYIGTTSTSATLQVESA